jgi:hypothetical protein
MKLRELRQKYNISTPGLAVAAFAAAAVVTLGAGLESRARHRAAAAAEEHAKVQQGQAEYIAWQNKLLDRRQETIAGLQAKLAEKEKGDGGEAARISVLSFAPAPAAGTDACAELAKQNSELRHENRRLLLEIVGPPASRVRLAPRLQKPEILLPKP